MCRLPNELGQSQTTAITATASHDKMNPSTKHSVQQIIRKIKMIHRILGYLTVDLANLYKFAADKLRQLVQIVWLKHKSSSRQTAV